MNFLNIDDLTREQLDDVLTRAADLKERTARGKTGEAMDGRREIRRGDQSGTIGAVSADLLTSLLADGSVPVVSPPMLGDEGEGSDPRYTAVNTDADRASAAVAGELGATLVSLTDVEGVYRDPEDPSTLVESVETPEAFDELESAAEGFMGRKVMAATEALEGGASEVVIASANAESPIRSALAGGGTHVFPTALE
jgi:acetylglutamate/LysW-gamma-L-alpha-aminoadipate kinase